ncbi:MAG: hypothetical protein F4Y57_08125 [Acidobacteria bacterium]|nr:hypothetical protein [Acidobacteriota bacterium]
MTPITSNPRRLPAQSIALVGLAALLCAAALPPAASAQAVTFNKDVAPLMQRSCETCHRPNSIAPMSLQTYEEIRPWARNIRDKITRPDNDPDRMPPWFIEKNIGIQNFKEDISLSPEEVATIAAWVDGGAERGNPADLPPPIEWPDGKDWSFGEPDLVISSPEHVLEAVAADWYGLLDGSPTGLTEDRWIKAVEVREVLLDEAIVERKSGDLNLFVVHHAVISARERSEVIQTQSRPGGDRGPADLFSVVHEVGQNATHYPEVLGVRLPAGSSLNWDLHLHSIGVEVPFRIDVAFKFHPKGWEPKYSGRGGIISYLTFDIDIPPEEPNAVMEGMQLVTKPGIMMTFEPHLHSSGKRMCIEAIYPTGLSEMLNCAGYNHNWVKVYVYDEDHAPLLPVNTILRVTAWYDNTLNNPRVTDPRNWKGYGNRSTDDMFLNLSRFVPITEEQYEEELARRQGLERARVTQDND